MLSKTTTVDLTSGLALQNQVKVILVKDHFDRSLPSSIGSLLVIGFMTIIYQFGSVHLADSYIALGLGIALTTTFRAIVSYLGVKGKISILLNEKYLKIAVVLNSAMWGLAFCLDSWYGKPDGIEKLVTLSLIFGLSSVAPIALVTVPWVQTFFFVVCLLAPAIVYIVRIFDGSLPAQAVAIPGFLLILFFYQLSTSRKLLKLMIQGIENNLTLQFERETLKGTLKELRETQGELSLERAKALNSERLAFLGSMASGVAHEINNPLTISGGQVFKIQNHLGNNPDSVPSHLIGSCVAKIAEMNIRIRNIVRGLQYFSRERKDEEFEVFPLSELMELTALFFNEKMKKGGIHFELEPSPPVSVKGQKNELSQALFNILDNSIEALQGIENPRVAIRFEHHVGWIRILISDNGKGISEATQERIFDPFFTTKDVGQGTGLGLSVARGIVKTHGGDIRFQSQPGDTIFTVSLPLASE